MKSNPRQAKFQAKAKSKYNITMTSHTDLIKAILRFSDSYTREQLEMLPDEELIMLKLIAERKHEAAKPGRHTKNLILGSSRKNMMKRGRKKK